MGGIGIGAFLLLAKSVQNSAEFDRLQPWILLDRRLGVIALVILLARKLWRLVRDYRAHVPGSRLTARTVAIFGALVIAPLLIVYLSSLEFINRGIDSWFKVEVKQGLNDALVLSRAALDLRMREYSARTVALADALAERRARRRCRRSSTPSGARAARSRSRCSAQHGRIIAASLENAFETLPSPPPPDLLRQVEQRLPYVSLEPQSRRPLPHPHRAPCCPGRPAHASRATWSPSTRCRRSSPRSRRRCRAPTPSTATSPPCASR